MNGGEFLKQLSEAVATAHMNSDKRIQKEVSAEAYAETWASVKIG